MYNWCVSTSKPHKFLSFLQILDISILVFIDILILMILVSFYNVQIIYF